MFKRLLVPLDGSRLAEAVLPAAVFIAEHFQATIILFHALEQAAPATVHGERHLMQAEEAGSYLAELAARVARPNLTVETNVHPAREADVARSIIEHITELSADLVFLCAHGRSGLRDMVVGSIAQQVISGGTTPVFFVRPSETETPFECHKILVPLDSEAVHEPAVPVASALAQACGAALSLLTVVPTSGTLSGQRAATGMLLPATMTAVLDLAQRGAVEYLQDLSTRLMAEGVGTTATVTRGEVAPAILSATEREQADLIVLATHGRRSLDAFWSGSVTPKILGRSNVPVLLVRVTGEEPAR